MGRSIAAGRVIEVMCRQFIRLEPGLWTHDVPELAVWWRANDELEIVGHDRGAVVLAAEATWTNAPVDLGILHTLQRRVALLPSVAPDCQLVLFARSGFTPEVAAARTPYLGLYTLDDLLPESADAGDR